MKLRNFFVFIGILYFIFTICLVESCSLSPNTIPSSGYDNIKPIVSILSPSNGQIFLTNTILFEGTAIDYGRGIEEVFIKLDNQSYISLGEVNSWSTNLSITSSGEHVIYAYAIDKSGNYSDTNQVLFYVDLSFSDAIYVSANLGNDTNSGLEKDKPVKSIQVGIELARSTGKTNILVSVGIYTPGNGMNTNDSGILITNFSGLRIVGGASEDFVNLIGMSELDGNGNLDHVVSFKDSTNVSFERFTIRGGNASSVPYGGGIYIENSASNVISNVVISNNVSQFAGGGIAINNSHYNTISGNISSNYSSTGSSYGGGGIYLNQSHSNTINVVLTLNEAAYGGGLFLINSTSNFIQGLIESNTAYADGGGIYIKFSSKIILSNINISYNNSRTSGGGYISASGNITLDGNILRNNATGDPWTSGDGGGFYLFNVSNTVISGYFEGNYSTSNGGAIFISSSSSNYIIATIVSNTSFNGGGIFISGNSNILEGNITLNEATNGAGIFIYNSISNTVNSSIISNKATSKGGGLYIADGSSYNSILGYIIFNTANMGGGGYITNSHSNNINANFYSNTCINNGGGLYIISSITNVIDGNIKWNNSSYGGGIYLRNAISNLINGLISENIANMRGGGIYCDNSYYTLISGNVANNHTTSSSSVGGGIAVIMGSNNTIKSSIYNNSSINNAGGILVFDAQNLSILDSYITNNYTSNSSSNVVIHLFNGGNIIGLVISNCYIGGNDRNTSCAIMEEGNDTVGHKILYNKFITNNLNKLYQSTNGGFIPADPVNWNYINNTNSTGASEAIGNTVINM